MIRPQNSVVAASNRIFMEIHGPVRSPVGGSRLGSEQSFAGLNRPSVERLSGAGIISIQAGKLLDFSM